MRAQTEPRRKLTISSKFESWQRKLRGELRRRHEKAVHVGHVNQEESVSGKTRRAPILSSAERPSTTKIEKHFLDLYPTDH